MDVSGTCTHCGKTFSKRGMTRHLTSCLGSGSHRLVAFEQPNGPWWLYVIASPKARLRDLDQLLRDTWLECCGHMSAFEIEGSRFEPSAHDYGWGPPARSMSTAVDQVLRKGVRFTHEYDFGSTTLLRGRVVGLVDGGRARLSVVARNERVTWPCDRCETPATAICSCCGCLTCGCTETCPECDEYFEEMALPVVNSPRMGVCGYAGP